VLNAEGAPNARGTGRDVRLVPTSGGAFGAELAGDVLLAGPNARITPTTFDEWLATRAPTAPAD
jgi:hypothetical protein